MTISLAPAVYYEGVDPRAWFIERIRSQAAIEKVEFTDFERKYLETTAAGDDEAASGMLKTIKGKPFEAFDARINGLAWRAYQRDLHADPGAQQEYDKALRALANIDHYPNLSMFINSIALKTPPDELNAKTSWRSLAVVIAILLTLIVLALLRR